MIMNHLLEQIPPIIFIGFIIYLFFFWDTPKIFKPKRNKDLEKTLYEHIMDGPKTHIELTLRSGGYNMQQVYNSLLYLIEIGSITRTKTNKFKKQ